MKTTGTSPDIPILYEDNHLLALYKPSGVLSQQDYTGDMDMLTLGKQYIRAEFNKPGNVYLGLLHRLDRPVAGVMLFAKTSKAAARISKQIKKREIQKHYLAITEGSPPPNGMFSHFLCKNSNTNTVTVCNAGQAGAKKAELTFFTQKQKKGRSLVSIMLITGRPHQIRVQFSHEGYPIVGDAKYGKVKNYRHPVALFAHKLTFFHPVKQEKITISAPIPATFPWADFC